MGEVKRRELMLSSSVLASVAIAQYAGGIPQRRLLSADRVIRVATLRDLRSVSGDEGAIVWLTGIERVPEGGHGTFYWDGSSSEPDDGGTIIAPHGGAGRWKRVITEGAIHVHWFGARGDGANDDTGALQAAIDAASRVNGRVMLSQGKTYLVGTLTPRENVTLLCQGATLRLRDNQNSPLLFDGGKTSIPKKQRLAVIGGTFDLNKEKNDKGNLSAGFLWISGWQRIFVLDCTIKSAFRNVINIFECDDVTIRNLRAVDCGQANPNAHFSYGIVAEPTCRHVHISNVSIINMYGYGVHFNHTEDFTAENLNFESVAYNGAGIAITFTQAKRGRVSNVRCDAVDGDNIEINASEDLTIENVSVRGAGNRPFLTGDNETGISNHRILIRNARTTGTIGPYAAALNYLERARVENCEFDKDITLLAQAPRQDVRLVDCTFASILSGAHIVYGDLNHVNTRFRDCIIQRAETNCLELAVGPVTLDEGGTLYIPLGPLTRRGKTANAGVLEVVCSFVESLGQGSYQEFRFYHFGETTELAESASIDGSFGRRQTVAVDKQNQRIGIANESGVKVNVRALLRSL